MTKFVVRSLQALLGMWVGIMALLLLPKIAEAQRIRDLARIKGVRPQHLTGIGLVIGLNATGDSQQNKLQKKFYLQLIQNMGTGIPIDLNDLKTRNTALVVASATVPSSLKVGSEFDVTVSSVGDAESIVGGYLLAVPLRGPNAVEHNKRPSYYAIAQGRIYSAGETGAKLRVGKARAVLESPIDDLPFLSNLEDITLLLNEPAYGTASRVAGKINEHDLFRDPSAPFGGPPIGVAVDSGTVRVRIPTPYLQGDRVIEFISQVLEIEVPEMEREALVAINRQTGAVVVNGSVRVASAALISFKGVLIRIPKIEPPKEGEPPQDTGSFEKNPLLIDVINALEREEFTSSDVAHILRQLHKAGAIIGKFIEE